MDYKLILLLIIRSRNLINSNKMKSKVCFNRSVNSKHGIYSVLVRSFCTVITYFPISVSGSKHTRSNSGTMAPLANSPRLPPLDFEGQVECSFASSLKFSGVIFGFRSSASFSVFTRIWDAVTFDK